MDKKRLFHALQKRSSMQVARRVLAANGFPRGTGWKQIIDNLKQKSAAAKADFPGLEDGLRQILITTDKSLRLYKLDPSDANLLRSHLNALKIDHNNVFARDFPYPVEDTVLRAMITQPTQAVAKFQGQQCFGVLFSSVNIVEVRDRISPAQIGIKKSDYDEIIGIKK